MDPKDYSPMGKIVHHHINFLNTEMATSWIRIERLQEMSKNNQYADNSIQEMIYSERRVWSAYKHSLANIEIALKNPEI